MSTTTDTPGTATAAPLSLPARLIGVLTAPRATYADVAARPRWIGMMAVVVLVGALGTFAFLSTEVGRNAMLDQQIKAMESFGITVSDQMYAQIEGRMAFARVTTPIFQAIGLPLMCLIVSGLLIAVFNAIMGGNATFKQVYSIVVHAGAVMTLATVFGLPLAYARGVMSGATNLGVFFPFLDENTFPARFLGSIDLFLLWWLISLSIGMGVLYKKKTAPIANSLVGLYVIIGFIIAAVKTALSGA